MSKHDDTGGGRSESGDLRALVRSAWELPGAWHRVPGLRWALRFPPRDRFSGDAEFEIRDGETGAGPHGYRRAGRGAAPTRAREDSQEHGELSFASFPESEAAFARAVAGVLDEWPDSRRAGGLTAAAAAFARWYLSAFESAQLPRWQRFVVALTGSGTFCLALTIYLLPNYGEAWLSTAEEDFYFLPLDILFYGAIFFTLLFAFLCSWNNRMNGPLRLYAISFLFPYAVWGIVKTLGIEIGAGSSP